MAPLRSKPVGVRRRARLGRERYGDRFIAQHTTDHKGRALDRPLGTVTCAAQHWHLVEGSRIRALTVRELARAQGLREDYILPDHIRTGTRLVGNAIAPALAEWACEQVQAVL